MFIGYIYKTTNLLNNRSYIGKKKTPKFDKNYYGSGVALQSAIKKYGKENFIVEAIAWGTTISELNDLEIANIAFYKNQNNLYNIAKGGDGGDTTTNHPDKENIVKNRAKSIKNWHDSLNEEQKLERGRKISNSKKGKSNGHEGFYHSDATKTKMSKVDKGYTKSIEWKLAHDSAMAKRKGTSLTAKYKSVIIDNIEYVSIGHAMAALGIKHRATFYKLKSQQKIKVDYK